EDGRALLNSDPYFCLPLRGTLIALLDTGVRFSHALFANSGAIRLRGDCINGGDHCDLAANPGFDPTDHQRHGTGSAGILVGSAKLGQANRGVTRARLDSFKIYTPHDLDPVA